MKWSKIDKMLMSASSAGDPVSHFWNENESVLPSFSVVSSWIENSLFANASEKNVTMFCRKVVTRS